MIEVTIKNYLDSHINVPVFFEYPSHKSDTFIILEKTSSSKYNKLTSATFAIQSYALSMYEAAKLNETVKYIIEQMIELDSVNKVSLNSDYNYTDTEMKVYRYQAVFDIIHY